MGNEKVAGRKIQTFFGLEEDLKVDDGGNGTEKWFEELDFRISCCSEFHSF